MRWVDAHCHLEGKDDAEVEAMVARARAAGLVRAVVIGQFHGPGDFGNALRVARRFPDFVTPTMGIHPHDAARATEADWAQLQQLCSRDEVSAVGEAGLDYFYDHSPRDVQRDSLWRQCELSNRLGKPLVVHVRDAHEDCHRILKETQVRKGVIHCFTGQTEDARRYLELGLFISLSGVITYKKSEALQDAARFCPLDRLMVETDSPYLAPAPLRGKRNEPAWVVHTAHKLAELKGVPVQTVAEVTTRNAATFFGFALPLVPGSLGVR
jgi:TatD DNase family protein